MMARSVLLCASCAVAWLQPRGLRVFAGRRFAGEGDVGSPGPSVGEFSSLAQLEARLSAIEGGASSKLRHFYEPSLHSFMLEPGTTRNFSVTSSAICVETLLDGGVEREAALEEFGVFGPVAEGLARSPWRPDDFLQAPLVVIALARLAASGDARSRAVVSSFETRDRLRGAVLSLLEMRPHLRDWKRQKLSCYLHYYLTRALLEVVAAAHDSGDAYAGGDDGAGDDGAFRFLALLRVDRGSVALALTRAFQVARDELCRQVAAAASGDSSGFDVTKLASSGAGNGRFNVASTWVFSKRFPRERHPRFGFAPREMITRPVSRPGLLARDVLLRLRRARDARAARRGRRARRGAQRQALRRGPRGLLR